MILTSTEPRPLIDQSPPADSFSDDLLQGLRRSPPEVPCKYLYDRRGSSLFDRICELDEYYATRTEMSIMRDHEDEIVSEVGRNALLVEYGSGSSLKTRILLDGLEDMAGYVPIDISREHLLEAAADLAEDYPELKVQPICADYTQEVTLPDSLGGRRVIYFPGSTIGNFDYDEAVAMLKRIAATLGAGGHLLIGVDLKKDEEILHRAYNDDQGITAAFNKNVLHRMVNELGVDLDPHAFAHRAPYFPEKGYVEMRLVCRLPQQFYINGERFSFEPGDYIRTERSYKYTVDEFADLAAQAGFQLKKVWTDDRNYFSIQYHHLSS